MRIRKGIFFPIVLVFCISIFSVKFWLADKYVVPVFMYHEIEKTDVYKPNYVSPENFEKQIKFLKENKYNVIGFGEFLNIAESKKEFPRNTVVITFDDGSKNNYTKAFPILQKYNLKANFFVPSDKIGLKGKMSEDDLRSILNSGGLTLGTHGRTEPYLPDLSEEEQIDEIVNSKRVLEELYSNTKIETIAYPIGGFSEKIKSIVKKAGYRAAFATNRGYDKSNKDLFEINRIRISNRDTSGLSMWIKCSGYYNAFRRMKNPY